MKSWMRRKQFEAQIMAQEIGRLFGASPAAAAPGPAVADRPLPAGQQWVSPDAMLDLMGIKL